MEYDVFISCKSEDYIYAEEIYNFLKENGFNVFLANKELRQMGDSEYRKAISQALKSTYHLIVFASKTDYVDSTWVYYEWDWFLVAKIKGKKPGKILSILKDISIDDINADLWKYESKSFYNYKESLIAYVETPAYIERKEEERRKAKLEEEKIKKQKEEAQRKERIRNEIKDKEAEYSRHSKTLDNLANEIVEKHKLLGEEIKNCPICNEETPFEASYCKKCGWAFVPIFATKGISTEEHLFIARSNWKYLEELGSEADLKNQEIENAKREIIKYENELNSVVKHFKENEKVLTAKCVESEQDNHDLQSKLAELTKSENSKNSIISRLQKSLEENEKKCLQLIEIAENLESQLKEVTNKTLPRKEGKIGIENINDNKKESEKSKSILQPVKAVNSTSKENSLFFSSKEDIYKLIMEYCKDKTDKKRTKLSELEFNFKIFIKDLKDYYGITLQMFAIKNLSVSSLIEVIWKNRNKNNMLQSRNK